MSMGSSIFDIGGGDTGDGGEPPAVVGELQVGMDIGMVFTALGGQSFRSEVDPDQAGGGRLLTVDAVEPGAQVTITWRETVERETAPEATPDRGVGEPTPTPAVETVERTCTLTASGLADAHESFFDTGLWSLIEAVFSGYQIVSVDGP